MKFKANLFIQILKKKVKSLNRDQDSKD